MTEYAKGDVLLSLRDRSHRSRESVAAEIGVTTKTLYGWETRNKPIKWENAKRVARFYDVAPESLVSTDADDAAGLPSREQLDRIETKLDALLAHHGIELDGEADATEFAQAFEAGDAPASEVPRSESAGRRRATGT